MIPDFSDVRSMVASYPLNPETAYMGDYIGDYYRVIKGNTQNECSSQNIMRAVCSLVSTVRSL